MLNLKAGIINENYQGLKGKHKVKYFTYEYSTFSWWSKLHQPVSLPETKNPNVEKYITKG